jgi:hypothetical protein
MSLAVCCSAAAFLATLGAPLAPAMAQMDFLPAQDGDSLLGPTKAQGAIIWSHGRSVETEDSRAPTPDYIAAFRAAGWDTFRLNRLRFVDTLPASGAALAGEAVALKAMGYRRVVLAGQSFGAFISLIAAGETDAVDAVIGTAPAAFGTAQSNPGGYRLNATRLYELLAHVREARVALFFFDGDVFDPGGRGTAAERILGERRLPHLVVDRPADFSTHWAAAYPSFTRRFASCLAAFAGDDAASGRLDCGRLGDSLQVAGLH